MLSRKTSMTRSALKTELSVDSLSSGARFSNLAAIHYPKGFHIDELLSRACSGFSHAGMRVGGLLQVASGGPESCATSVHVRDLRTGEEFDIWEDRGTCASGCRLDEGGLLFAATAIEEAIRDHVDLIVFNRFGRAESCGRGLLSWFVEALDADIAVLTAVRKPYDQAWKDFHGGFGSRLEIGAAEIYAWAQKAYKSR